MRDGVDHGRAQRTMLPCACLLLFFAAATLAGEVSHPWSFHAELDLYLSLKAGAEYRISDHLGVRGSFGTCVISPTQFSYTLIGIYHLLAPTSGLQVDLHAGLVQAVFDILEPIVDLDREAGDKPFSYWVPGLCVAVGYRWPSGHGIALRGGAGVMFGYDLGAWQGPDIVPNLALEYSWRRE